MPINNIILPGDAIDPNIDPYFNFVKFLMNGTGKVAGDTTFTDFMGHTVTPSGGVVYSNDQPLFGLPTIKFDGVDDFLTVASAGSDFAPGTGDFTHDVWVYINAYTPTIASGAAFATINGASSNWGILLGQSELATRLTSNASGGWGDNLGLNVAGKGTPVGAWALVTTERFGDKLSMMKNGQLVSQITGAAAFNFSGTNALIGRFWNGQYDRYLNGYIGPQRFTKGKARNNGASFVPPTKAFAEVLST